MLADGTPSHPMDFHYRLRFDRPLAADALRSAVFAALARHPLLAARVDRRPGRPPRFIVPPADVIASARFADRCVVAVAADPAGDLPAVPALDLDSGPLVRLIVVGALCNTGTDTNADSDG